MELIKLLFSISLIFIAVKIVISHNKSNDSFEFEPVEIRSYNINLILFMNKSDCMVLKDQYVYQTFKPYIDEQLEKGNFVFYGESTIHFKDSKGARIIRLHVYKLVIDETETKIIYNRNGVDIMIAPEKQIYHKEAQVIEIYFDYPSLLHIYTYRLIMKFVGRITDKPGGFVKTSYIDDKGEEKWLIVAAGFQGPGARQIFPCWDKPYIRNNFTISIKHRPYYTALSSERIVGKSKEHDVMPRTYFKTTDKISPYQVAIIVTNLNHIFGTKWWYRPQAQQEIKFAMTIADLATFYLKGLLQNVKFSSKMDYVVHPGFQDEGVENWGLILYRESSITYNKNIDFIARKFQVAHIVTRKIVHQFFGNMISQSSWSYLWLNEGIATLAVMQILRDKLNPELMDLLTVQFREESFRVNDYYDMPLTSPDSNLFFNFSYYVKAPIFIRSLLQEVPVDAFMTGLINYLTMYQFKSIDTSSNSIANFLQVLQNAVEYDYELNINYTKRFIEWTYQKRYPVLQVTQDSVGTEVAISLSQELQDKPYPRNLWICVTYTTQSDSKRTKERWLSPHKQILNFNLSKESDWVLVNVRQTGYYRVNYDEKNWRKFEAYLNSEKYINIHVLNRAQIIDDAYYFLSKNKLHFSLFKNLTYYLAKETYYTAWYPVFKILEQLSIFFPFSQSTKIKEHFGNVLHIALREMRYAPITEMVGELNDALLYEVRRWTCVLKYTWCTISSSYKLKRTPSKLPIFAEWQEWSYCKGLSSAGNTFWRKVFTAGILEKQIEYLSCSKNHTVIIDYIKQLEMGYFEEQDHIIILQSIIVRHAENDFVLDYMLKNLYTIQPRMAKIIVLFADIINHLYSGEKLDKVKTFAKAYLSYEHYLHVEEKILIRANQIDKHISYFENFLPT